MDYKSQLVLEDWFFQNIKKPYASRKQKIELAERTSLSISQVSNWLLNKRKRFKKKKFKTSSNRLSTKAKLTLSEYFMNISKRPDEDEIAILSIKTGLDIKRITTWFAAERFKKKGFWPDTFEDVSGVMKSL